MSDDKYELVLRQNREDVSVLDVQRGDTVYITEEADLQFVGSGGGNGGGLYGDDHNESPVYMSARASHAASAVPPHIDYSIHSIHDDMTDNESIVSAMVHADSPETISDVVSLFMKKLAKENPTLHKELAKRQQQGFGITNYYTALDAINALFEYKIPRDFVGLAYALSRPITFSDFDKESRLGMDNLQMDLRQRKIAFDISTAPHEGPLKNCGNTCYLISMIHYIYHCVYFAIYSTRQQESVVDQSYSFSGTTTAIGHVRKFLLRNIHCQFFEPLFEASRQNNNQIVSQLTESLFEFITSKIEVKNNIVKITERSTEMGTWSEKRQNDPNEAISYFIQNLIALGYSFENSVTAMKTIEQKFYLQDPPVNTTAGSCIVTMERNNFSTLCYTAQPVPREDGGKGRPSSKMPVYLRKILENRFRRRPELRFSLDDDKAVCITLDVSAESLVVPTFIHVPFTERIVLRDNFDTFDNYYFVGERRYTVCDIICKDSDDPRGGHYIHIGLRKSSSGGVKWVINNDDRVEEVNDLSKTLGENERGFHPVSLMLCLNEPRGGMYDSLDMENVMGVLGDCIPEAVSFTAPNPLYRQEEKYNTDMPVQALPWTTGEANTGPLRITGEASAEEPSSATTPTGSDIEIGAEYKNIRGNDVTFKYSRLITRLVKYVKVLSRNHDGTYRVEVSREKTKAGQTVEMDLQPSILENWQKVESD